MQMFIWIINDGYQEVTHLVSKTNSYCIDNDIYTFFKVHLKNVLSWYLFSLGILSSGNQFAHESSASQAHSSGCQCLTFFFFLNFISSHYISEVVRVGWNFFYFLLCFQCFNNATKDYTILPDGKFQEAAYLKEWSPSGACHTLSDCLQVLHLFSVRDTKRQSERSESARQPWQAGKRVSW